MGKLMKKHNTNQTIIAERQDNHYTEVLTAWQEDGWDYDENY